jgi:hypothetical protein
VQRMLRRDCRLSHSARQRQGDLRVILPRGCRSIKPADYCHSNKCPLGNSAIDEAGDYTPAASAEQPHRDRASSGHWPQCVCCTSDVRSSSENDTSSTRLARAQVAASTVLRCPASRRSGASKARVPDKMRHAPARIDSRGQATPLRRHQTPKKTQAGQGPSPGCSLVRPASASATRYPAISSPSSIRSHTLPLPWGSPPSTPDTPPAPVLAAPAPHDGAVRQRQRVRSRLRPAPQGARHPALVHVPQDAQDERQTLASIARSKSPSWMTTRRCASPTLRSSTAASPTGSAS